MLLREYFEVRDTYNIDIISRLVDRLNSIFICQIDSLHSQQEKIQYWQHPLEAQSFKLSSHISSLRKLMEGSSIPFNGEILLIRDVSSMNILVRAIIENYLTIYHFHFDRITDEQKEFRFLVYARSALKNRQKFREGDHDIARKRIKEKAVIDEYQERLKANLYYQSLNNKQQMKYLKSNEAKELNWVELLSESDLKPNLFLDTWRLFSNYAHSEFLSVLQISDINYSIHQNRGSWLCAELTAIVLASSICNLGRSFKAAESVLQSLEQEDADTVKYFYFIGNREAKEKGS